MSAVSSEIVLVDAHVHLHPGNNPGDVLSAAAEHMNAAARQRGLPARPPGILVLTESAGADKFAELEGAAGNWQLAPTAEEVTRLARPVDGTAPIAITSGRQVVTEEGLEVHALGTRRTFADGRPLREMLIEIPTDGALPVLPWGVGKWSGRRGRVIAGVIGEVGAGVFLADSGVRPGVMPRPGLLAAAEALGMKVLAGTDPLPLAAEAGKAGRFGFVARCGLDPDRPFATLAAWLGEPGGSPETYGRLEGIPGFLRAQIAMQIAKRLRR